LLVTHESDGAGMTRLGTWLVRGSLGETPASVMRRTTTGLRSVGSATREDAVSAPLGSDTDAPTDRPDPIPPQVYNPGPLDDAHREYAGAELDALIGAYNRGRMIAVAVRETTGNN